MKTALHLLFSLLFATAAAPAIAQDTKPDDRRQQLDTNVVKSLIAFTRRAESSKCLERAREVYQMILDHYDSDNTTARRALGFKRQGDGWLPGPAPGTVVEADSKQQDAIDKLWATTKKSVAALHRELGVALQAEGEVARAHYQFERALSFDPEDVASHRGLGHEEIDGFLGTTEQIAFVRRMREILAKAREITDRSYEVEVLPADRMPVELKQSGLPFSGAKSKHFTHWVIDSTVEAAQTLQSAERSYDLVEFLLGSRARFLRAKAVTWFGILRTHEQRDILFAKSPNTTGRYTLDQARLFGGINFDSSSGNAALVWQQQENDADHSVAHVTKRHFLANRNVGLGEGLVHVTTWLLCGSMLTTYASLPKTVSGGFSLPLNDPEAWQTRLEDEIEKGEDWPLVQIPRERSDSFRPNVRVKSWSFMVFLVARYPDRWFTLLDSVSKPDMLPEDIEAAFQRDLGRSVGDVEAEWRAFARRGSEIRRACGW